MATSNLPPYLLEHIPWGKGANPIWPATTFVLRRNIARQLFPTKIAENRALLLEEELKKALLSCKELQEPQFFSSDVLTATDKEHLFEHFLRRKGFPSPVKGQGFLIDKTAQFLALVNIEDHLQLHLTECKKELEGGWHFLSNLENQLAQSLDFAFSPQFGYLTADPASCGTAFKMTTFLHLPALILTDKLQDALAKQNDEEIEASSLQGGLDEFLGDILVLNNRFTLGVSEENIFYSVHAAASQLALLERAVRDHMHTSPSAEMKDHISRAFGLLMHSYQLQTKETLQALSLMKLGLDLGWVEGVTDELINEVFFHCRRAHLTYLFLETDPSLLPRKRAELIHSKLAPMQLKTENH